MVPARPGLSGRVGWVRSRGWLAGVTKIKDGVAAGRALTYASVTGKAKAASTRGQGGMSFVVGFPLAGSSADNPSATEGETGKPGPSPAVADACWRPRISLDLGLLVHAQHHRLVGGVQVQADDVDELLLEPLVIGDLERPDPVRLDAAGGPDPLHRRRADPLRPRHAPARPVVLARRLLMKGGVPDRLDLLL